MGRLSRSICVWSLWPGLLTSDSSDSSSHDASLRLLFVCVQNRVWKLASLAGLKRSSIMDYIFPVSSTILQLNKKVQRRKWNKWVKGPWKPYGLFGPLFHILCCGGMYLPGEMELANAGEVRATGAEAANNTAEDVTSDLGQRKKSLGIVVRHFYPR